MLMLSTAKRVKCPCVDVRTCPRFLSRCRCPSASSVEAIEATRPHRQIPPGGFRNRRVKPERVHTKTRQQMLLYIFIILPNVKKGRLSAQDEVEKQREKADEFIRQMKPKHCKTSVIVVVSRPVRYTINNNGHVPTVTRAHRLYEKCPSGRFCKM